jgi:RNA polymerase sigma-70 factor (ECF subfamily)
VTLQQPQSSAPTLAERPEAPVPEELELVAALRRGDERAFQQIVTSYSPMLLRLAQSYVSSRAVAEEVVQETWLGVIKGLDRFEGRSSLKTWIFRILANVARTRAVREGRSMPFSSLVRAEAGADEPTVEPERFLDSGRWEGHWASYGVRWETLPEASLHADETRRVIAEAIEALPHAQRQVISLRDVHGMSSEEICEALEISEVNQRVLLHRARAKVRRAIEVYLEGV